ncbi:hypothetical protein S7711_09492 [Stachybotrys chartarum IBT 7711]|uniref:Uncharacterized protein n=1 Tax=Stachybotrys chartarum (strain CBS 109288 / IBT 7711) TaxID=1280523 RepID=A0A084B871_STACB|nr:hypothetical protein S7711_09492 [Stachybotrys chartarum IBT 7711]
MPKNVYQKLANPKNGEANKTVLYEFALLADKLGLKTQEIHDLIEHDPDEKIARRLLRTARDPSQYRYKDFKGYIGRLIEIIHKAEPLDDEKHNDVGAGDDNNDNNDNGDDLGDELDLEQDVEVEIGQDSLARLEDVKRELEALEVSMQLKATEQQDQETQLKDLETIISQKEETLKGLEASVDKRKHDLASQTVDFQQEWQAKIAQLAKEE